MRTEFPHPTRSIAGPSYGIPGQPEKSRAASRWANFTPPLTLRQQLLARNGQIQPAGRQFRQPQCDQTLRMQERDAGPHRSMIQFFQRGLLIRCELVRKLCYPAPHLGFSRHSRRWGRLPLAPDAMGVLASNRILASDRCCGRAAGCAALSPSTAWTCIVTCAALTSAYR